MESHNTHGWLIAALWREMWGLESKAMFECVESSFTFNLCLRQGSVEAHRLWQVMAAQILANVEGTRLCIILRLEKWKEPESLKKLHVGGVDGISCQHLQVMVTNLLQNTG